MSTHRLDEPVLEPGVRFPHFFNGRMLSGEDLTRERAANFTRQRHLATALGTGIAYGFEVSYDEATYPDRAAPVLTIKPGLALSASGHTLRMENPIDLAVVEPPATAPASTGDLDFADCETLPASVYLTGTGVYLLTVGPADRKEGSAPVSGLGNGLAPCNAKYIAEGVRFSLLPLDVAAGSTPDRARNEIAYQCFGFPAAARAAVAADLLGIEDSANPLADLVTGGLLTDCDVPLAILQWDDEGLGFVDMWAARRALHATPAGDFIGALASLDSLAEAMVRQFQDHIDSLARTTIADPVQARRNLAEFFKFLPPFGVIPIQGLGSANGFSLADFIGTRTSGTPTTIEASDLSPLLFGAGRCPPVDVDATESLQLYQTRGNLLDRIGSAASQLFVIFVTRESHGFAETDAVATTLGQTWKSYDSLLRKMVLLPRSLTDEALPLNTALTSVHQTIIGLAMVKEGLAVQRALNSRAVIATWRDLYDQQKELTRIAQLTYTGDTRRVARTSFATALLALLDGTSTAALPTLLPSLDGNKLLATVAAQNRINQLVSGWSGDLAFGFVGIQNSGSPDGLALVPGDANPYVFNFIVTSRLDIPMTISLAAAMIGATSGSWGGALVIKDAGGTPLTGLTVNPDQATPVTVEVRPPANAAVGQNLTLRLTAAAPAPTSQTWSYNHAVKTAAARESAELGTIRSVMVQPFANWTDIEANTEYEYDLDTEFSTALGAGIQATCFVEVTFSYGGAPADPNNWRVKFFGQANPTTGRTTIRTPNFTLPATGNGGKNSSKIVIRTPLTAGTATNPQTATFTIRSTATFVNPATGATVTLTSDLTRWPAVTGTGEFFIISLPSP